MEQIRDHILGRHAENLTESCAARHVHTQPDIRHFGQDFTFREYVADGVVHGLGVISALIGSITLILWASGDAPMGHLPPLLVYGIGMVASFALSAAYNMTLHTSARSVLRRFDHAAIFLFIAATYTPIALIGIGGSTGVAWAALIWSIALFGMLLKLFFLCRFERTGFMLTLMLGWIGVLMIGPLLASVSLWVLVLLVGGGFLFTIGTLFHLRDHWPFNRAIWHVHVLLGAAAHYAAVVMVVWS
ncbi:hemolysin III [Aliiroseovarius halocynthiae]|uniref:Hemolysin III family protein n=1 Tax=Aliiroseovarius halocynthiae TaxID=985055 RepID=A0A545SS87_9RHOB|nr:hemolysin III family protein [Aliiroseovarius halocynthiae]TQV67838.1 hemolysin III family protein [Aliiroseovarius halocynthiae]SMR72929.1 hemolysin III [Aliiroseovarius halocynthiae]